MNKCRRAVTRLSARFLAWVRKHRGLVSGFLVWIIAVLVGAAVLWIAVDHANVQKERATKQSNRRIEQKFRQAIAISDAKHRQSLHAQSVLFAYSINRSVCGFRSLSNGAIKAARQGEHDPRLSVAIQQRNANIVTRTEAFLATQVTIPSDFDCSKLRKKPPKEPVP